jgi:hypothetical protein
VPIITEGYAIKAHLNEFKSSPVYKAVSESNAMPNTRSNGLDFFRPYLKQILTMLPMTPISIKSSDKLVSLSLET